jgi:hypothetical protein
MPTCLLSPLKLRVIKIIIKNSVHTSKKKQYFSFTKINWLMLFREIITVYSEHHMKPINTLGTKCRVTECYRQTVHIVSYHWS